MTPLIEMSAPAGSPIEITRRCPWCQSSNVRPFHLGNIAHLTMDEWFALEPIQCQECGAIEDHAAVFPEMDALDEMLEYYAEAPDQEPPPDMVIAWEPPPSRRPPTIAHAAGTLPGLSPRESEVARLVAAGRLNKQIAYELGISENTVRHHIVSAFGKLGMSNRTELAVYVVTGRRRAS
jgi:DNA-binding CsgD family transcriptional regulator